MMKQVNIRIPFRMLALFVGLLLSVGAFAQITVKGHVKDAQGEPVIGATIRIADNAAGGAVSDFDGNFTLKAKQGATLSVSYVGYQTATVKAAPNVVVTLQDDAAVLDNVVVIGYGRAKKTDLTGSVTAIKPDEMSKGITTSASDMLVGKVAGVDVITSGGTPGAGAQIRIRGGASLSASNDPLYVIDGLIIDNNTAKGMSNILAMVNPNDIETFTVLKDASATAIYGSRASNGVIIITTKKGKKDSRPQISYNATATISQVQKKYEVLDAPEYKALVGTIAGLDATLLGDADTDWQNEIFRTSLSNSHNVSLAGGLKNTPYRLSLGYDDEEGIILKSWMKRYNASLNLAPKLLNDHLNLNVTAKFLYEKDSYVDAGQAIGGALSMDPTRPVYMTGADARYTGGYYQTLTNAENISDPTWAKMPNSNAPKNPVAWLDQQDMMARAVDWSGNFEADYAIHGFEDLHLHASLGAQYTDSKQDDVQQPTSFSNNYYGYEGVTRYWKYNIVGNAYAQYMKEIGVHNIDVMAGAEQSHYHRTGYNEGQGWDPYTNVANNPDLRSEKEWESHNSLVSYIGRLNYTLLDRYMLTATFRADGSSRFAEGNKWGYFPAVALAWKINNEPFLKNVNWIDELKLRASWGKTGQQNGIDDFYYTPLYVRSNSYAQYPFGSTYYYTMRPSNYNTDLTWEKTTTWGGGLDFMMLNGRFGINIDGYYRKTTDLLATIDIPAGSNFGDQQMQNIGSLENYGVELAFDVKPIVTRNFTWQLTYNVGWNHNEITELNASADYVTAGDNISRGNNTKIQRHAVGHPMNSFFVYQQVYDEAGRPIEGMFVDRNADGQINSEDGYYYKSPAADVIMGLTTKFIYKNWDLSAAFHSALGNYVYYDFLSRNAQVGPGLYSNTAWRNTTAEAVELGWTAASNAMANENYMSDYFVRNASYLKCTNITLGYSFAEFCKLPLNGRIFATVQNPFIITKYDGIDPEVASGIDSNPYPRPVSYQLGLNLNF